MERIDRRPDELARRKGFVQPGRATLLSLLAGLLSTVMLGCADPGAPPPEARPEPLRLVFISCAADAKFFEPVKQGMRDAARMLNVQCEFKGTPCVDVKAQAEMVRQAVRDGCQGIALNLIDPVGFDDVVKETIDAGVPVVGFNVDDHATPNARLAAVNQRLCEAGVRLGKWVAPHLPNGSQVLLTMHDQGVSALDDRARGIRDALKDKQIQWTQLITGNISTNGAALIAQHLREHPEIRVVLGTGQSDTEAAGLAIRSHFAGQGYWSAGFDLSPTTLQCIQEEHIRATVDQQPYLQGFYPVVQLTHYLRYGLMPSDLDAGAAIIDRHNVNQVLEMTRKGYR